MESACPPIREPSANTSAGIPSRDIRKNRMTKAKMYGYGEAPKGMGIGGDPEEEDEMDALTAAARERGKRGIKIRVVI